MAGIGKVTFQQCAGFLKILGGSEPLDATIIHPESYGIAKLYVIVSLDSIRDFEFELFIELPWVFLKITLFNSITCRDL